MTGSQPSLRHAPFHHVRIAHRLLGSSNSKKGRQIIWDVIQENVLIFVIKVCHDCLPYNNNNQDDIYGAVIMAQPLRLSAEVAANPQTKPADLDCK